MIAAARRRLGGRARAVRRGRLTRLVRAAGLVAALGGIGGIALADLPPAPSADARTIVALPSRQILPARLPGYQLATDSGDVVPFGAAASGAAPAAGLSNPVVAVARTLTGAGAWTATADGGVLTSGDARFYGSLGGHPLNQPVTGVAATPTGRGYWLVSADGGVFAFGDAPFFGSMTGQPVNGAVVSLVPTPTGRGYWLASSGGGVFTFGDARYYGGIGSPLQRPITSMATLPSGRGYWLAAADGGVFTFGDAPFAGRPDGALLQGAVVGIASSHTGRGYLLAAADGGVFTFGDAPFLGSSGGKLLGKVVGIAAGTGRPVPKRLQAAAVRMHNRFGNDISWPQCDNPSPAPGYGFGIVGVTDGHPFSQNPCLAGQWRWATAGASSGSVYLNLASAMTGDPAGMHGPAGDCSPSDLPCQTYNFSANNVDDALGYARASGVDSPMWWLDVEVFNRWSGNPALNTLSVHAAAETLQKAGIRVGVYSTPLMWGIITGGAQLDLPVWVAGAPDDASAPSWCKAPDKNFTGGGIWLVQSMPTVFDVDYACEPILFAPRSAFRFDG